MRRRRTASAQGCGHHVCESASTGGTVRCTAGSVRSGLHVCEGEIESGRKHTRMPPVGGVGGVPPCVVVTVVAAGSVGGSPPLRSRRSSTPHHGCCDAVWQLHGGAREARRARGDGSTPPLCVLPCSSTLWLNGVLGWCVGGVRVDVVVVVVDVMRDGVEGVCCVAVVVWCAEVDRLAVVGDGVGVMAMWCWR